MSTSRRQIPYITLDDAVRSETLQKYIYPNLDINYYWSDDFSPQMYIALARAGFISVTHQHEDQLLLLPEMQKEYAVLDFENLHVSSNVKKLLNKREYILSFNTRFNDVIKLIQDAYEPCWLIGEYADLMKELAQITHEDFALFSTELHDKKNGALVAGEIGYVTKSIYTSLSGFHINEKSYNNWGTLQLVLLGQHLQEKGVRFWNLGHASMKYKTDLGAKILARGEFLEKWNIQVNEKEFPLMSSPLQQLYDDIERKELRLRVWSGYETGIGKLSLLEENAEWIMVEHAELNLSEEVRNRFKCWREMFRETSFDQQLLDAEGLELAKALKKSHCYGRIVEYQYPNSIQKIVSYQVRADYSVSLWDDTWSAIDLEYIKEDLGGYVIEECEALQERFTQWEEWHYRQLTEDIDGEAFNQEGEALAEELQKRLPAYCVVYYSSD